MEGGAARARPPVEFTEHEAHEDAGLADHAGLGDGGADLPTPPMTASLPRIGMSRSLASMPFWSGMTAVVLPTSGRIAAPALRSPAGQRIVLSAQGRWRYRINRSGQCIST